MDGTGPTYVESGNADHQVITANLVNGVLGFNHVKDGDLWPIGTMHTPLLRDVGFSDEAIITIRGRC